MIGRISDTIQVERGDGTIVKLGINPHGLVVTCEDDDHPQTDTLRFAEYPELRNVYDEGWVLPEVTALVDEVQIRDVRLRT